jgi:uncharacterized delta-60 repeat protein
MRTRRRAAALVSTAVALFLVGAVVAAPAQAAAGDLDPTFSVDGKQRTDFGNAGPSSAAAAVRQADGRIVVAGAADGNFLVARYNLDGSLDSSFSGDGRVQTSFTGLDGATDVALQGDKIVAVGFSTNNEGTAHFALARYNPDGSLDPNFSGDGKQTTAFGAFGTGGAFGVAIHDGKIVAVGQTNEGGSHTSDFALARYNLNGSLDASFSGDGTRTLDLAFGEFALASGVAIQADGKIVAVGQAIDFAAFALARFNPNGSLDTSFSGDGLQTTDFGVGAVGREVALQGDGKIVAVGNNTPGESADFALARYNANGSLDTSFAGDGLQTTDFLFGGGDVANDVAIQANGRIVAVGFAGGGATGEDFALARYSPDGSLDTSFSGDGRKRTSFSGTDFFDSANGVALQGDGRIVAVGAGADEVALARYLGG